MSEVTNGSYTYIHTRIDLTNEMLEEVLRQTK